MVIDDITEWKYFRFLGFLGNEVEFSNEFYCIVSKKCSLYNKIFTIHSPRLSFS